jgi:putative transposase
MSAVTEGHDLVSVAPLCAALDLPRATYYRQLHPWHGPRRRATPQRALSKDERVGVLGILHEPRFEDLAPEEIYATLLDENRYVCSARTMYRILDENAEIRERRDQLRHPEYKKPELLATAQNQLWSWDITKLLGPKKWTYYQLYVILDVFSRYVVGWMIAHRESATLAKKLIDGCYARQNVVPGQLTVHADRGPSMRSKALALMLADLGVTKTHSRPHVSNDNPYSESHFKTLKYRPDFPARFGCIQDARAFCTDFFQWYNVEHHHSGLAQLTPHDVHHGLAEARIEQRRGVLSAAFAAHPERFVNQPPVPALPPDAVWINKPSTAGQSAGSLQ